MPRVAPLIPRQMLPPPTTIAISTPRSARALATSSAMRCTTFASMPYPIVVSANASPESFSTTRLYWLPGIGVTLPWLAGLFLAHLDTDEAPDLGLRAQTLDDLRHRRLGLLHEPLLEQAVVLEEAVETAGDDLLDRVLGLALVAGELLEHAALLLDDVGGDVVA